MHLPVVENSNFPSNAHEVPATLWPPFATRGGVDRLLTTWITKLNVRYVQIVDIPEVGVIGDRDDRFSGLGLRETARLCHGGGVETLVNKWCWRFGGKCPRKKRRGGWRGMVEPCAPHKVAPSVMEVTGNNTRFHAVRPGWPKEVDSRFRVWGADTGFRATGANTGFRMKGADMRI